MEAIRKGPWKYVPEGNVRNRGKIGLWVDDVIAKPGALFYLPEDPDEQNDVAALYPAKVKELRELLDKELAGKSSRQAEGDHLGGAVQR